MSLPPKARSALTVWAWVVAGVVAVTLAVLVLESEYDLGIFGEPTVASGGVETTTTSMPVTTAADRPDTTATTRVTSASPPTTLAPLLGWNVGSCVAFEEDLAEPVSCAASYDAVIVASVEDENECPMASEWVVELEDQVACLDEDKDATNTDFPRGLDSLEQGRETWVVVLATASSIDDPALAQAVETAAAAGYLTSPTDCDFGAAEALGVPEDYFTVSVYLRSQADAHRAQEAFASLGVAGTVAQVETYCLD